MAVLVAGVSGAGAQGLGEMKFGIGAQTSAANKEDYHMGVGADGSIAMERAMGAADSRFGVRGSYLNYERDNDASLAPDNYQEYSAGVEALVGPTGGFFEPKVGGHVGWVRQNAGDAENDLLDVGADVMASFGLSPGIGLQAVVTPLWLIDDEDTDYQTRGSVNIQFSLPGA